MSDMSVLSHEYAASASFAEEVNGLVLKLKKTLLKCEGASSISPGEIEQARNRLAAILRRVCAELGTSAAGEAPLTGTEGESLPEDVLERLRTKHHSRLAHLLQDLDEGADALLSDAVLDEAPAEVLDELCDVADRAASTAFRRLWRK